MEAFTTFKGIGIPIDIINCDTDQIIPARFLRKDRRDPEMASFLWHDLRKDPDFIFNRAPYSNGKVVVADINWGCGSSREGAVYALNANGIRAVIAPSFGDIHYNNMTKNGLCPVQLSQEACQDLRGQLFDNVGATITVDLEEMKVIAPDGTEYEFQMHPLKRRCLLEGMDDIALTTQYMDEIKEFEARHHGDKPFMKVQAPS